jgi:hypothetical protein
MTRGFQRSAILLWSLVACFMIEVSPLRVFAKSDWPPTGKYSFAGWAGPALTVYYSVPPGSDSMTPIVVVVPGKKRNAEEYRDEWNSLATANRFITLVLEAKKKDFPSEYQYNLGGVTDANGGAQPREKWLFSAIDPLFDDFKEQFGSTRKTYSLYGHSAGGGFVHLFMLMIPDAKVDAAVAANAAFYTMPDAEVDFPFGLRGLSLPDNALERWYSKRLTIMLGDRDLNPRTEPLSSGVEAQRQGPHGFARGLGFYRQSLCSASSQNLPLAWRLEIVPDAAHDNKQMAPAAVKHLFALPSDSGAELQTPRTISDRP